MGRVDTTRRRPLGAVGITGIRGVRPWPIIWAIALAASPLGPIHTAPTANAAHARASAGSPLLSGLGLPGAAGADACIGPNDLLVRAGTVRLQGTHSYDRLCVEHGARLLAQGRLRAGLLYVDADSAIDGTGLPGGEPGATDCAPSGTGEPAGDPGEKLVIVARQAVILGSIAVDGGHGVDSFDGMCGTSPGPGGAGGHLDLTAAQLTLGGQLMAKGGDGGDGTQTNEAGGAGGAGGTITITTPRPLGPAALARVGVAGGAGGAGTPAGHGGQPGSIRQVLLGAPELAALPPAPAPLLAIATSAPRRLPPLAPAALTAFRCGPGDLDVGHGTRLKLAGSHRYGHICVHDGGILNVAGDLRLDAATILVGAGSTIRADGAARGMPTSGRYSDAGPLVADRRPPHPGARGANGDGDPYNGIPAAKGGAGGGVVVLTAPRIVLAGTVSANGANGVQGVDGGCSPSGCIGPFSGAGGGSGGGILIRAADLQITGRISAAGGAGGAGGSNDDGHADAGVDGSAGYVKLLAGILRTSGWPLPLTGAGLLAGAVPSDPAVPSGGGPAHRYLVQTWHNLNDPFATYYSHRPDAPTLFGLPRSEAFRDPEAGGVLTQYFERAALRVVHGAVTIVPLGRLLTAGRRFALPAGLPAGAQRFANGFALSGAFLQFWRLHGGEAVLGVPISQPAMEKNGDGSGRAYLVQWTTNARLEYHPELAGTGYAVSLGLLGDQTLGARGWL